MGRKQYKAGKDFEEQLCWWLRENGYYPEYHEKSASGSQNGDITAIKNNIAFKIEAKHLQNKSGLFPLSRIESNQMSAYKVFKECGNNNIFLAIQWNNSVWFINFDLLQFFDKSIDLKKIEPNITNWNKFVNLLNKKIGG